MNRKRRIRTNFVTLFIGVLLTTTMVAEVSAANVEIEQKTAVVSVEKGTPNDLQETQIAPIGAKSTRNAVGNWVQSGNNWWFQYASGGYPANQWEFINYYWYYFDANG